MRDKKKQLKKNIQKIVGLKPNYPINATVSAISGKTCSVKLSGGLEITDIKLTATTETGTDYFIMVPKVGSDVMMISSDGSIDNLTVIKCNQVESFSYSQNGLSIDIDSKTKKISLKNNEVDLKDIFADIVDALQTLKVFTAVGPSEVPIPTSMAKINKIETDFKKILK